MSEFCKALLKKSEGYVSQVYDDHAKRSRKHGKMGQLKSYNDVVGGLGKKGSGNPTIGYGHLIYGGIPFRDERERWKDGKRDTCLLGGTYTYLPVWYLINNIHGTVVVIIGFNFIKTPYSSLLFAFPT